MSHTCHLQVIIAGESYRLLKGKKPSSEKITFVIGLFPLTLHRNLENNQPELQPVETGHASVSYVWARRSELFVPVGTNWLKEILNNRIQLRFKECKSFASLHLSRLELLMRTRPYQQGRRVARMQTL